MGKCLGKPAKGKPQSVYSTHGGTKKLAMTKGRSMYIPEDHTSLQRDNLQESQRQIIEFFEEELDGELMHNVYATAQTDYKVGDSIEYAPDMEENLSFELPDKREGATTKAKITFAYKTLNGKTTQLVDKANQDSLAIIRLPGDPHQAMFSVFDGHGPYGEHASHFCRMEILKMYALARERQGRDAAPESLLSATIHKLHKKFAATNTYNSGVDPFVSGTTGIIVFLNGRDIIAANVGDSRAVLGSKDKASGSIEVIALSSDHKPQREDEKKRIEQTKAVLLTEHDIRGTPSPNGDPGKTYICREKKGEIVYGVLFSRSIGDVDAHRHLGVITDPEFDKAKIDDSKEQCVIVASDGVWDQMTNEEVVNIVFETHDPLEACNRIVKIASTRWTESEEHRRDDITLTVIGIGDTFPAN